MASAAARWRVALRIAVVLGWCAARCSGGASAYTLIGDVAEELDDGAIVEVGSDRGEGSTGFLSALANRTGREFFTVDFSSEGFANARGVCGACARQGRGEAFLQERFAHESTSGKIAAAYLDNYDWTFPWTTQMSYKQQQRVDYTAEGLELSNERSRATHLVQAQAVEGRCTERCFVLFDDTWPMNPASGRYDGKGGAAVDWLLSRGFELVEQSSPEQASHLGFVLVRRLPVEERPEVCSGVGNSEAAHEEIQSAISAHEAGTRLSANEPDATRVFITSPAEEDEVPAGAVLLAIAVTGLRPETHSLIVFAQGVELMRVTRFEDEASECADPASLQASETRGEAGVCADGEVEVRRVGVSILMEPGVKVFSVHVQDAMTRRTDAEVSRRVTVVSASA